MKPWRLTLVLAAMLFGSVMAPGQAAARGGHSGGHSSGHGGSHAGGHAGFSGGHGGHFVPRFHAGVFIGAAPFAPLYFYPPVSPYYNYGAPPAGTPYWYFCASAGAYYPYVGDCPEGWQQVVPQPSS
jgi:hypothetical protein